MNINYNSTSIDGTYQAVLYEANGQIDFIYGGMAVGASSTAPTVYVGMSTGSTLFNAWCVTPATM